MKNYLKKYDKKFYNASIWKRKRLEILTRDNFECQMCKANGKFSRASVVHHIKHYDENPHLALTDSNLISLCESCHNVVHPEKSFKNKNKIHKAKWK